MLHGYFYKSGLLQRMHEGEVSLNDAVWIDMISPDLEEEKRVENLMGVGVPTKDEMEEIEISSRLYNENGAAFMTAILPSHADGDDPQMHPVTFVLTDNKLVTIRYSEPRAFTTFPQRAEKVVMVSNTSESVLVALLEAVVDRLADILERTGKDIDGISRQTFKQKGEKPTRSKDFQTRLEAIGRKGDLTSNIRDSLVTLERLVGFLAHAALIRKSPKDIRERIKTLSRDVTSLADHASFFRKK